MTEIERIARLIFQSLHHGGLLSPDDLVYPLGGPRESMVLLGFFTVVPATHSTVPAWTLYAPAARNVIADEERRREKIQHHSV